ncbi:hypothetical protein OG21DRAFT_210169 [Imleria badia]|nr:hypothetical protein OG21DRAFT_210169 [Imleria badia]
MTSCVCTDVPNACIGDGHNTLRQPRPYAYRNSVERRESRCSAPSNRSICQRSEALRECGTIIASSIAVSPCFLRLLVIIIHS